MSQYQNPQGGYGQQPGGPGYGYQPQPHMGYGAPQMEHPQSQTVFILGIAGIFVPVCSWIAWYLGSQARKEIESGAPYPWTGNIKTGYLLGKVFSIIGIVVLALYIIFMILLFTVFAASAGSLS